MTTTTEPATSSRRRGWLWRCYASPRALQASRGLERAPTEVLDDLFPPDRAAPIVSVQDGRPHTLAFLGAIRTVPQASLGVGDFGQSGDVDDLYRHFGVDADTIVGAAYDLMQS